MAINWEDIVAGGEGAVNEALFGLPEFAVKKLGGKKAVEDYIAAHKTAHDIGGTIGTVGSMFIPIPGAAVARGAGLAAKGAKAIKAADTAMDAAKLVKAGETAIDVGKIAKGAKIAENVSEGAKTARDIKQKIDLVKLAKAGALSGAAESGIRGVTSEKSPSEILNDIKNGAMFGAGGGVAGGVLSAGLKKLGGKAGTYADEAGKLRKQYMEGAAGITGRDTRQILKEYAGQGAKGLGKYAKAEDALSQVDRIIKEGELYKIGGDDKYFGMVNKHWQDMNDAADSVLGKNISGSSLFNAAIDRGADDIAGLKGAQGEKVKTMLGTIAADGDNYEGIHGFKKFLDDSYKDTFSDTIFPKSSDKQAARDAIGIIRRNVDDLVADAAETAGIDPAIIAERRKNYIFDRALGESFARQVMKPKNIGAGSPTAMRTLTQGVLGAGVGYASGDSEDTVLNKLKRAGAGVAIGLGSDVLGGALGRAAGSGATRALANSDNLVAGLQKLAPGIEAAAGKISTEAGSLVGGQAASIISRKAIESADPKTTGEAEAAETAAVSTDEPKYLSRIMQKMQAYAAAKGVSPDSDEFKQFAQQVYAATDGFSPDKIGMVLYSDPEEQKAYVKALQVSRQLRETMPGALSKKAGIFSGQTDEEKIARETASDKLASLVGDVAKSSGSEAAAKKSLLKILNSGDTPDRKEQLVKTLLSAYGVDVDEIDQMGAV